MLITNTNRMIKKLRNFLSEGYLLKWLYWLNDILKYKVMIHLIVLSFKLMSDILAF